MRNQLILFIFAKLADAGTVYTISKAQAFPEANGKYYQETTIFDHNEEIIVYKHERAKLYFWMDPFAKYYYWKISSPKNL